MGGLGGPTSIPTIALGRLLESLLAPGAISSTLLPPAFSGDVTVAAILSVTQGDFTLHSEFTEPAFEMFRDAPSLCRHLYENLQKHGLRLADMRMEQADGSVGQYHLLCSLFRFTTSVRVGIERLEVGCFDITRIDRAAVKAAAHDALTAVKAHLPKIEFKAHNFSIGLHGTLSEGASVKDYLARFCGKVDLGLGPAIGTGVVYYYGAEAERLLSTITLDMSALVAEGLFARVNLVVDGQKVATADLPELLDKHFAVALAKLGIEPNYR